MQTQRREQRAREGKLTPIEKYDLRLRFATIGIKTNDQIRSEMYRLGIAWRRLTGWMKYAACPPEARADADPVALQQDLIYGLVDPRTRELRYTGLSTVGLRRPRSHRDREWSEDNDSTHTAAWITTLRRLNMTFSIVILEYGDGNFEHLCAAERFWIAFFGREDRDTGVLTNHTDGGEGGLGACVSEAQREARSVSSRAAWEDPETAKRLYAATQRSVTARAREWSDPASPYGIKMREVLKKANAKTHALYGSPMKDPVTRELVTLNRRLVAKGVPKSMRLKLVNRRRLYRLLIPE